MYEINHYNIKKDDIFVCVKGMHYDGHNYINDAFKNGAKFVVGEQKLKIKNYKRVRDSKKYLNKKLSKQNKRLSRQFYIIGITGTKGKTSSAIITYQLLRSAGIKAAYIGTLGLMYNDVKEKLLNTTPDILTINKILTTLSEIKITHIVMEISSHSLVEKRIAGMHLDIAGYTNLSRDHLDYHKDMHNYLNAKLKILKYLEGPIVVNSDDKYSSFFLRNHKKHITFGTNGDYKIKNYDLFDTYSVINFSEEYRNYTVVTPFVGKYNVYNYMLALAITSYAGIDIKDIINYTNSLELIPGRNELITSKKRFAVVDYAHNPESVLETIKTYKEFVKGRIITIIGCGGNRDKTKRPIMANIATSNSDYVIFTSDNPRDENPVQILNDMTKDLSASNYMIIENREQAIKKGVKLLKDNDYLLVLGKGHEDYQIKGNIKYHFDDKEIILKYLN